MLDLSLSGLPANDAWIALIRRIYEGGAESHPRNLRIKELVCHTTRVDMRWPIVSIKRRKMGFKFLAAEACWILSGKNDVASLRPYSPHIASFSNDGYHFDGAYGPKIIDQLRYIIDTLERDPDSRQAVIEIWRPNPRDSRDVPCTLNVQWLIRDGKLNCIDTMRSSDAWLGWPYDTFNFSMLSTYVLLLLKERNSAKFADLKLGALWLTAGSSHLYINPKEDGATNIPYSLEDVQGVLSAAEAMGKCCHAVRPCACDDWQSRYAPLDPLELDGPTHLIEHLSLCKDKRGVLNWMLEFQKCSLQ
jgi:thymidylate synthase